MADSNSIEYLRTFLQGDREQNRHYERILEEQGWAGFGVLLSSLFYLTVTHRLGPAIEAT